MYNNQQRKSFQLDSEVMGGVKGRGWREGLEGGAEGRG